MKLHQYTSILILFFISCAFLQTTNAQQDKYGLRIGVHYGMMNYYGDLSDEFRLIQPRPETNDFFGNLELENYGLSIEKSLSKAWSIGLSYENGFITANDRAIDRDGNIQFNNEFFGRALNTRSEIQAFNFYFTFHTDNEKLFSRKAFVTPFFKFGAGITQFDVFGDLFTGEDQMQRYYYWSDNTIRNLPELPANIDLAQTLAQDGNYETQLNGLETEGKDYNNTVLNVMGGVGLKFRLGSRFNLNAEYILHYLESDYLDDVSDDFLSTYDNALQAYAANPADFLGTRRGSGSRDLNDFYSFLNVSLHYNLGRKKEAFIAPQIYIGSLYDKLEVDSQTVVDVVVVDTPIAPEPLHYRDTVIRIDPGVKVISAQAIADSLGLTTKTTVVDSTSVLNTETLIDSTSLINTTSITDSTMMMDSVNVETVVMDSVVNKEEVIVEQTESLDTVISEQTSVVQSATLALEETQEMIKSLELKLDQQEKMIDQRIQLMQEKSDRQQQQIFDRLAEFSEAQKQPGRDTIIQAAPPQNDNIKALEVEIDRLKAQLNNASNNATNQQQLEKQLAAAEDKLTNEQRLYNNNNLRQFDRMERNMDELKSEIRSLKNQNNNTTQDQNNYRELKNELAALRQSIQSSAKAESVIVPVPTGNNNQQELKALREQIDLLNQEIGALRESRQDSMTVVVPETKDITTNDETLEEMRRLKDELAALKESQDKSREAIEKAEREAKEKALILQKKSERDKATAAKKLADEQAAKERRRSAINTAIKGKEVQNVFFNVGSSQLNAQQISRLDEVITLMQQYKVINLSLQGFTDPSGNAQRNILLANKRTDAVKNYIISRGISLERLAIENGQIDTNPINASYGRRVTLKILF